MDRTFVKTKSDLEDYISFFKSDFKDNFKEWENGQIETCLDAAIRCIEAHGDRNARLNLLYDGLNYEELKFVAILLLTASYKTSIEFVQQDIFNNAVLKGAKKGVVFSIYLDKKIHEYHKNGLELEDSMNVFFDKLLLLLKTRIHLDSKTNYAYFDTRQVKTNAINCQCDNMQI